MKLDKESDFSEILNEVNKALEKPTENQELSLKNEK